MGHDYYDPTTAVTLYIEQARNENAVGQLVSPISNQLLDNVSMLIRSKHYKCVLILIPDASSIQQVRHCDVYKVGQEQPRRHCNRIGGTVCPCWSLVGNYQSAAMEVSNVMKVF